MPSISVRQDIRKDAWNWWHACNRLSHGVDWKQRISIPLRKKIAGGSRRQAFIFLIPYLKNLYKTENIGKKKKEMRDIFNRRQKELFARMEKVTGKKIYKKEFTCFLTTFPRGPYDYSRGYVWIPVIWPKETYIRTFVHELLHFQTYRYWKKRCLEKLNQKEFENLKEALTVILNEEFMDLIVWPDKGYAMHANLREKLAAAWQKNKDFDALINAGIRISRATRLE